MLDEQIGEGGTRGESDYAEAGRSMSYISLGLAMRALGLGDAHFAD